MDLLQEVKNLISKNRSSAIIAASMLFFGVLLLFMLFFMNTANYKVLFTGMSERDISAVTDALINNGIDFKVDEKNGSIVVSDKQSDQARMFIMTEGVLSNSSVGFEIFDNSEFGMTEFSQKINYKRALEGELSRTISSLNEIKYARVHIVQPSSKLFQRKDDKASASIILFMKNNVNLAAKKIAGIQNIVASSVDGLTTTNVVISNQAGEVLSSNHDANSNKDEYKLTKKEIQEQYFIDKVSRVLDSSIGSNNYVVSVNIELDYTRLSKTSENYITDQDGQVIARKRTSKNKNGDVVSSDYEYRYGKVIENTEEEIGKIKRIKIGVVVPMSTTNEQMSKLKDIIEMAGGIDKDRGDMVTIHNTAIASKSNDTVTEEFTIDKSTSLSMAENISNKPGEFKETFLSNLSRHSGISEINIVYFVSLIVALSLLFNFYLLLLRRSHRSNLSASDKQKVLDEITVWFEKGSKRVSE